MRARKMIASAGWEKQNQRQGRFKIMCLILLPQIRAGILDPKADVSASVEVLQPSWGLWEDPEKPRDEDGLP